MENLYVWISKNGKRETEKLAKNDGLVGKNAVKEGDYFFFGALLPLKRGALGFWGACLAPLALLGPVGV